MNTGAFVLYRLSDADVRNINFRRARAVGWAGDHDIRAGQTFPAMVVRVVAAGVLDLRVFLNGTDDLWRPSVPAATDGERGAWSALPTEEAVPADPPGERVLRANPGEAPRTVKTRKESADA